MENIQHIIETVKIFASSPNATTGLDAATAIVDFATDYIGVIIFALIGLSIWRWSKKFKAAGEIAKTGFQGMLVSKAFANKKSQTIKVMGLNINGLGIGDIVTFDKDPFQTKCKVGALNLVANGSLGGEAANNGIKYSWGGASATVSKSMSFTELIDFGKKAIQAARKNALSATVVGDKQNGKSSGQPSSASSAASAAEIAPFSAAQDYDVKVTAKPAPVSNEMIVLEFANPTEFSRLIESQAIGQGNRKVLKAKDLRLVLREKAKKQTVVMGEKIAA